MGERQCNKNVELSTFHQYNGSSYNILARSRLYEERYTMPYIDMEAEITRRLGLVGEESILDTGCADGKWLRSLIDEHGHTGTLVGINSSENVLFLGQERAEAKPNLKLQVMDARELVFDDNSFDVASAQNLYYHIDDYENALLELRRVAKPNARVVVSTKGEDNLFRIWEALKLIERRLNPTNQADSFPKAPESFYKHFELEEAEGILSEYFEVIPELSQKQNANLIIYPENWDDYERAILSFKDSFQPIPRKADVQEAIDEVIRPIFDREIELRGFFTDYVQRGFFICRNKK
jgi:ubiquinone/menaquinone biosynthesis C-methylase UbiE